jgi:pseudouridine kinase
VVSARSDDQMDSARPADFEGHVLVIGSAGIDVRGYPETALQHGMVTGGEVRFSCGGVARNIAENLGRLEIPTILLTAVGDDPNGQIILDRCREVGIDITHIPRVPEGHTGGSMAFIAETNDVDMGINDYSILEHVTRELLLGHASLFADAALVAIDATLSTEALATAFELAEQYGVLVCADPTSAALAGKMCDFLPRLYMIAPNSAETTALCGLPLPAHDAETAIQAARHLVSLGVEIAIITLGEQGLAYADSSGSGHIPAIRTHVVDPTGAGDALTAGVIFGLLNAVPLDEAMRLGVSAATLTLRSRESVVPALSQELLYDELVI